MSISIEFNKDIVLRNILSWTGYIAYNKYKEGILNDNYNIHNIFELNKDVKLLLAYKILRRSILYTPVDTGRLRNSVYIEPYEDGYEIGYNCDYAIYVHEIGVNCHRYPTQYKYLEDAAFEILNEYKVDNNIILNITMQYNPLRVFVGVSNPPGESLLGIKANEKLLNNPDTYEKLLNDFMNFDYDTGSEADKVYYSKMNDFFNYYENYRHLNTMDIIKEWSDRKRHRLG